MNKELKKAIKQELIVSPSSNLSDNVMKEIFALDTPKSDQPLISKTVWIVCSILFVGLVVLLFILEPGASSEISKYGFIDKVTQNITSLEFQVPAFLSQANLLMISAISLAIFLLISLDFFFSKGRKIKTEHRQ